MFIDGNRLRGVVGRRPAQGFTILELMVATAIFSVVMLIVTFAIMRTTDSYYGGVTRTNTQAAARAIIDEITQAIEFSKAVTVTPTNPLSGLGAICIDNTEYAYTLGQEVTDTAPNPGQHQGYHALVVESAPPSCSVSWPVGSSLLPGQRELLGRNMRLAALKVTLVGSGLYTIHVKVIYGDDALLTLPVTQANLPNEQCAGQAGSQFCAISDLTTSVQQRLL